MINKYGNRSNAFRAKQNIIKGALSILPHREHRDVKR